MRTILSGFVSQLCNQVQHGAHITENVFVCIENDSALLQRYNHFCTLHGRDQVNKWIGRLVRELNGLPNTGRCAATRTSLIRTYTKH